MPSQSPQRMTQLYNTTSGDVALTNDSTTSPVINYEMVSRGGFILTAVATAASLNYYVCDTAAGVFKPLYDQTAVTPVIVGQVIAVDRAFFLPTGLAGFPFFRMVLNAGTATARMCLKS